MKVIIGIVLCLALLSPGSVAAARLALVVGIDDYENIPALSKAVGDAEAMATTLSELGFEVTKVLNPDRRRLNQAITAFRRALKPGDAALVHFSGHGVEIGGRNLLLPRDIPDVPPGEEDYLIAESIDLTGLIDRVADSGAAVRIFIIDACRDNPLATPGERGFDRIEGLAPLDPPEGSFVLFSAASRQAALDDLGPGDENPTSVYTRVLIEKLKQPGLTLSEIARDVRVEVAALAVTVGRDQSPAYYDELNQDYVLVPAEPAPIPAPARPQAPAAPATDAAAFALAQSFNSIPAWQAFLKSYPQGFHADMARVALNQLLEQASRPSEITVSDTDGVSGEFYFPLAGKITNWVLDFTYTTECDNDHQALITSPTGRIVKVMDQGRHPCRGVPVTSSSHNDHGDWVEGTEAQGTWRFVMRDLEDNEHTGRLDAVSLTITVDSDGVLTEHKVSLDGLPKEIPNPSHGFLNSSHESLSERLTVVVKEFSGRLAVGYRTERANTRDCPTPCAVDELRTVTLRADGSRTATLAVELPADATRACLNMRGLKSIESAVLVMPDGRRIASQRGGDLESNGKSACTYWTADAHEATSWEVTLR